MLPRSFLVAFLGAALAAPALAASPSPTPPEIKAGSDVLLFDGSIAHVAADGQHLTILKGGKHVPLLPGPLKLKDGTSIIVGPDGAIQNPSGGFKHESRAVAPSHPGPQ